MKKKFRSFNELAEEFSFRYPVDAFQILFRVSNSWKHRQERGFNVTMLGATIKYFKPTQSFGARVSIFGINFNLSLHTKRI